jgi:hypothetical protein
MRGLERESEFIIKCRNVVVHMLVLGPWPKLRSLTQRTWHADSTTAMPQPWKASGC